MRRPSGCARGHGHGSRPGSSVAPAMAKQKTAEPPAEKLSRIRQRQKLIDACISALYQHGPSRTTIDKVTTIADMSPGIVNFYFETKAALLIATLDHLAAEFEERVIAPLAALRDTPVLALRELITLYLDPQIASPRKVSVWYAFWGEASARQEYSAICGKRDQDFAELVRDLVARLIAQTGAAHLDADAIALGLAGALELMWQEIAFQDEADLDRQTARGRCLAYLRSVFPASFAPAVVPQAESGAGAAPEGQTYQDAAIFAAECGALFRQRWICVAPAHDLASAGDYVAVDVAGERLFAVRDPAGAVRVFRNACLHRPHALARDGQGHFGPAITCPVDGAEYALDGRSQAPAGALPIMASTSAAGLIWVLTEGRQAASAAGSLAGIGHWAWPALQPAGAWQVMDVLADWKVAVEHWADVYLHGTAMIRAPAQAAGARSFRTIEGGLVCTLTMGPAGAGWSGRHTARLAAAEPGAVWDRRLLWPNLMLETRPEGATISQVLPLAPGRCAIRSRQYICPQAGRTEQALSYLAARLHRAWLAQDRAILESTQAGLVWPGYAPAGRTAEGVAAFWAWRRQQLQAAG